MEFVFVVERQQLFDLAFPQGLRLLADHGTEVQEYVRRCRQHGFFVERRKAEQDSSLKQIIPYVVVRQGDRVLLLERQAKQGESRLHGKLSIGIGGHINPVDDGADVLLMGLRRELEEELYLEGDPKLTIAGCLNDDATAVGSVHFGLVAVADLGSGGVRIRETDMMAGELIPREQLLQKYEAEGERFETWSAFLLQHLDAVLSAQLLIEDAFQAGTS
jgi:predicted NUDIX family phosphoesterase